MAKLVSGWMSGGHQFREWSNGDLERLVDGQWCRVAKAQGPRIINEYEQYGLRYREWSDGHIEHNLPNESGRWLVSSKCVPDCGVIPGRSAPRSILASDPHGLDQHAPGAKLDGGKVRWDLLDIEAIEGLATVLTYGAEKYTENGWKEVPEAKKRYFSAMMRHYKAMLEGEECDSESGLPHRHHFLTNAMFLCHFYGKEE